MIARTPRRPVSAAATGLAALALATLSGCKTVVMNPAGDIARQQADIITTATLLMLIIIVPVIALTVLFAWRYRAANVDAKQADYQPEWDHSTRLELVIWGAPLLIILALGTITWISTHQLDPFRPLSRLDDKRPLPVATKPLEVQAVALDWKWLFIYPEQGIATVNELAAPVDRPIHFTMTSSTVMNSLFIPAIAGQIYAMPGMQSQLNAVVNQAGVYDGFSGNYSGAGFSQMRFKFHGLAQGDFDQWVAKARASGATLDRAAFQKLEQPTVGHPVQRFALGDERLFEAAVNRCVDGTRMCMGTMMAIDEAGGGGKGGLGATTRITWRGTERTVVAGLCTPADPSGRGAPLQVAAPSNTSKPSASL